MGQHEPTIADDRDDDGSLAGGGGNARALDADLLDDDFPDDRPLAARDYGTTEVEQARRESLARRLRRELPDLLAVDPTALDGSDADDDVVVEDCPDLLDAVDEDGERRDGELVSGRGEGDDDELWGPWPAPRSAEEDAVHLVDAAHLEAAEAEVDEDLLAAAERELDQAGDGGPRVR
jgi:[ribosomal protein S5]-alanine N-acetyltransferase